MHFRMPTDATPHSFSSSAVIFSNSARSSRSLSLSCFAVTATLDGVTPISDSQSSKRNGSASAAHNTQCGQRAATQRRRDVSTDDVFPIRARGVTMRHKACREAATPYRTTAWMSSNAYMTTLRSAAARRQS